jgi:hypothetical protein
VDAVFYSRPSPQKTSKKVKKVQQWGDSFAGQQEETSRRESGQIFSSSSFPDCEEDSFRN